MYSKLKKRNNKKDYEASSKSNELISIKQNIKSKERNKTIVIEVEEEILIWSNQINESIDKRTK